MKEYTLGIVFNEAKDHVVLILKSRPAWQKGKYNFPGGSIEANETAHDCISREFQEECGALIPPAYWCCIGEINNRGLYKVYLFTVIMEKKFGVVHTNEDQLVKWMGVNRLPENIIANLRWITPYAKNIWECTSAEDREFYIEVDNITPK